jgi:hypothetical protein
LFVFIVHYVTNTVKPLLLRGLRGWGLGSNGTVNPLKDWRGGIPSL